MKKKRKMLLLLIGDSMDSFNICSETEVMQVKLSRVKTFLTAESAGVTNMHEIKSATALLFQKILDTH